MTLPTELEASLRAGTLIPYLGPDVLSLAPDYAVPNTPEALVALLTAKVSVPHKIRTRLTQSAQFIENFKHRKTLIDQMNAAFLAEPVPSPFHHWLAAQGFPLIVDTWYDEAMARALQDKGVKWGEVQGLSQSEHFGTWTGWYDGNGNAVPERAPEWKTLLYKPIGSSNPAANYLVSDTDYVEVLTEIDIQTPIPAEIQGLRTGKNFLFVGCRFNDQLTRSFARQIMKRSSGQHWAVMPEELTRMEKLFIAEQNITRIPLPLAEFVAQLTASTAELQAA
ncbi:SIR2 family NAD-dependent protein deacylase [Uliginosibacterium aquaticum]|uniref:SIR2 family protein n=1 Tax=Uliginosibacterium aquaticum TaxID=2731212 RepID=A0ABX2IKI9_9RHOO|nr:SIR2 family protein [Uliginosibacterium aquaticum]NSL54851.1 SIR2 family protein [Uliginosibacterium aquaticum]